MGEMHRIGIIAQLAKQGDLQMSWNVDNTDEVESARKFFEDKVIKNKWAAFKDEGKGTKGDRIYKFDPYAKRITLVPPTSGG